MRLWTIQPVLFYDRLCKEGSIACDASLSECIDQGPGIFIPPYDWMAEQMRRRIGEPPAGVRYPIWAWYALYGRHQKPDLRWTEFRYYSGGQVCIEVEIPDAEVLLSDEEEWHVVLNDGYCSPGVDIEAEHGWFERLPEEERRRLKTESWERIFDVFKPDAPSLFIQAVFWRLRLDQVCAVRAFKGWQPRRQ